ncbi:hypothetical protein BC835DRAFT_1424405 [Cytidiella melzeri]|nr:hypothetical protein BC835DRAFT_1424405 [Cytidiella melzeri]
MQLSTSHILFAAIVTGSLHMVTASAIPGPYSGTDTTGPFHYQVLSSNDASLKAQGLPLWSHPEEYSQEQPPVHVPRAISPNRGPLEVPDLRLDAAENYLEGLKQTPEGLQMLQQAWPKAVTAFENNRPHTTVTEQAIFSCLRDFKTMGVSIPQTYDEFRANIANRT